MLILAALVIVVIVVAIVSASASERPSFSMTAAVTLGGGVVVLVAVVALVIGRSSTAPDDHDRPDEVAPEVQRTPRREPQAATAELLRRPVDVVLGTARIGAGFGVTGAVLDGLADSQTRLVAVATSAPVILRECVVGSPGAPRRCAAGTPAGSIDNLAVGLVELRRVIDVPGGRVDCAVERCALVATTPNGRKEVAAAPMVFGRSAALPIVRVQPVRDIRPGDDVEVRVDGLSPGEAVTITWCAPPGPVAPGSCGRPATEAQLRADQRGTGLVTLSAPGTVGADRVRCGARARCAVAVLGAIVTPRPAEVRFAGVPGPDLSTGQLVGGLAAAGALAIVAAWLFRRRSDEHPDDPFWGVSLDVPEWEGIDLTVDDDELAGA